MSPTMYRNTGYSLVQLIEDIKSGRVALPDIQRPYVWSSAKTRDLFDSMYRGFPIGALMFWETGADTGTRQIGTGSGGRAAQLLIVDGQQRLTSLFAVLTGQSVLTKDYVHKRIRIAFRPEDESFEVTDAAIERDPAFIPDITVLWSDGYRTTSRKFLKRLSAARDEALSEDEEDELDNRINRVHDLRDFPFQVVELGTGAEEEQVAEIFVRINSEGVKLNQADFILTLMSVHWEEGRRQLEAFSRSAVDLSAASPHARNPYIDPSPDQMLRVSIALGFRRARLQHVYNILRGKQLDTGLVREELRHQQFERLENAQAKVLNLTNWFEFLKCLSLAGFRSRRMITSENALLFSYAVWLIGRFDFGMDAAQLRPVIARWFFMAHTTGRYTSSPESQLEADLGRLSDLDRGDGASFVAELDRSIAANFTNDYWETSLPNRLDTSSSRSPVLFAYIAALNLLDADVLFSDLRIRDLMSPDMSAPRAVERHHLFPKKHLADLGVVGTRQSNAIANMAYLDWSENSKISSAAPPDYWPVMSSRIPSDRLQRQIEHHALPVGWEQLDYATFTDKRRYLIAKVVRSGFSQLWSGRSPQPDLSIEDVIATGESQTVEFKSSARWNMHTEQADPRMEHVIVKTVCGFLNAEGGTLLVGVDDNGSVLGLDKDISTLGSKRDIDGYELFLRQILESNLSSSTVGTVRVDFPVVEDRSICRITVAAGGRPFFAKPGKGDGSSASEFWVRMGNATKQLHGEDMVRYQSDHWG